MESTSARPLWIVIVVLAHLAWSTTASLRIKENQEKFVNPQIYRSVVPSDVIEAVRGGLHMRNKRYIPFAFASPFSDQYSDDVYTDADSEVPSPESYKPVSEKRLRFMAKQNFRRPQAHASNALVAPQLKDGQKYQRG